MRRRTLSSIVTFACLALTLLPAAPLAGQDRPVELGVDARLGIMDPPRQDWLFNIQVPAPIFRIGFPVGEQMTLEPAFRLNMRGRDDLQTDLDLFFNLLWHSAPIDERPVYFGGGGGLRHISGGTGAHAFSIGARAGFKPSLGDYAVGRVGAFLLRRLENEGDGIAGLTEFGLELGISALIR